MALTCIKCNTLKSEEDFYPSFIKRGTYNCRPCAKSITNEYRKNNFARIKTRTAQYKLDNAVRLKSAEYERRFGITLDEYNKMLAVQNGVCAICDKPESARDKFTNNIKALAVDHCHDTGNIRGLLCTNCNLMLGNANDNTATLLKAVAYLKRS